MLRLIVSIMIALSLSACAAMGPGSPDTTRLAVQYATVKVISDSDSVTAAQVVEHVERVRALVEQDSVVDAGKLIVEARKPIAWDALPPEDALLLEALISQIEYSLKEVAGPDVIDDKRKVRILTLLDWIAEGAKRAG